MSHPDLKLNMQTLRRSRKPIRAGDIFVLRVIPNAYHFGRVVRTDVEILGGKCVLVYIYDATSEDKVSIPTICRSSLLVPPLIVGKHMWSKGYFETVAHRDLESEDVLARHSFLELAVCGPMAPAYCDETGLRVDERTDPCGVYAVSLGGAVDDEVSDALGIPRRRGSHQQDATG